MNYNEVLDIDLLEAYLDGKLDAKGMHRVEKLSLEDPFVAEALAGLSESPSRTASLSILQKQLHQRIAQKPIENKRWTITSQRLSIASAAAVLFITVSVLFWMKENSRRQIEANEAKNVKIEIAPTKDQTTAQPNATTPIEKEAVIDQAIEAAKTNTYAGTSKPKVIVPAPVFAPLAKTTVIEDAAGPGAPSNMNAIKEISAERNLKKEIGQNEQARLNEVIITDVGKKNSVAARAAVATIRSVEPAIGWAKFETYLLENNKLLKNKQLTGSSVQLSFLVQQNNRPTAIKVVSGLTKEENDEAIRLLSSGPDWKFNPGASEVLQVVTIKF